MSSTFSIHVGDHSVLFIAFNIPIQLSGSLNLFSVQSKLSKLGIYYLKMHPYFDHQASEAYNIHIIHPVFHRFFTHAYNACSTICFQTSLSYAVLINSYISSLHHSILSSCHSLCGFPLVVLPSISPNTTFSFITS